jgi:hypothetical protein
MKTRQVPIVTYRTAKISRAFGQVDNFVAEKFLQRSDKLRGSRTRKMQPLIGRMHGKNHRVIIGRSGGI